MRPDLRIVHGGKARRPVDTSNVVYLEDSRHGIEPPSVIEVCDALLPRLPSGVGGLYGRAVAVFLEMTGERWLRSRSEVGLVVSLSGLPRLASRPKKRRPARLSLAAPHWTLVVREPAAGSGHYHLLLPATVRSEPTVVPFLWDPGEGTVPVLHRLTFVPGDAGWRVKQHAHESVSVAHSAEVRSLLRETGG